MADLQEPEAYTWLCGRLPVLRTLATDGGWRERLDRIVAEVVRGGSAVEACHKLSYGGPDADPRGGVLPGLVSLGKFNIDPILVRGEYVCPHDRCDRQGSPGADGREPRCTLYGDVMRLRPATENLP